MSSFIWTQEKELEVWSDEDADDHDLSESEDEEELSNSPQETSTPSESGVFTRWLLAFLCCKPIFMLLIVLWKLGLCFFLHFFLFLDDHMFLVLPLGQIFQQLSYGQEITHCLKHVKFERMPLCRQCWTILKCSWCIVNHSCVKLWCVVIQVKSKGNRLKTVELVSKHSIFYPFVTYCYFNLEISIQHHMLNSAFSS